VTLRWGGAGLAWPRLFTGVFRLEFHTRGMNPKLER